MLLARSPLRRAPDKGQKPSPHGAREGLLSSVQISENARATASKHVENALELSDEEREQFAWTLRDSLHDAHEDAGAAGAWVEEIRRRVADYRANRSAGRPWHEVDAVLKPRIRGR